MNNATQVLKVAAASPARSVAGAIANVLQEDGSVILQAVGASAVNQAVKAIAIARGFMSPMGYNLVCIPAFCNAHIGGEERTSMQFMIKPE